MRDHLERSITERLRACSLDELRVLDRVLEGIELGRESYGPLDLARDARLWKREAAMELRDWLFYCAAHEVAADHFERERAAEEFRAVRAAIEPEQSVAMTRGTTEELALCVCGHPAALHASYRGQCLVTCECFIYRDAREP